MLTFCARNVVAIAKIDNVHSAAADYTLDDPMCVMQFISTFMGFEIFKGCALGVANRCFNFAQTKPIANVYARHGKKTRFIKNSFFTILGIFWPYIRLFAYYTAILGPNSYRQCPRFRALLTRLSPYA